MMVKKEVEKEIFLELKNVIDILHSVPVLKKNKVCAFCNACSFFIFKRMHRRHLIVVHLHFNFMLTKFISAKDNML